MVPVLDNFCPFATLVMTPHLLPKILGGQLISLRPLSNTKVILVYSRCADKILSQLEIHADAAIACNNIQATNKNNCKQKSSETVRIRVSTHIAYYYVQQKSLLVTLFYLIFSS